MDHDRSLRQRGDLGLPAALRDALRRHARRQGREAVAGHELRPLDGQAHVHVPPAQGRQVPHRPGDDGRRRQVLDRRRAQPQDGLGLHRRRDQERDRQGQVHGRRSRRSSRGPRWSPTSRSSTTRSCPRTTAARPRRRSRRPGRHRPVQVGSLDARARRSSTSRRRVLAEGQAVPGQRDVDVRPDDNTRLLQLKGGQAQIDEFPGWSQIKPLKATAGVTMKLFPSTRTDYVSSTSTSSRSRTSTCAGRSRT